MRWNYEGGIWVPTFITWPGNIKTMKSSKPVITMDIYPTLLELTDSNSFHSRRRTGSLLVH
jgi:arylsulfatase A-like enzyme